MSFADRELDNSFDKESRDKNSVLNVFHASRSSSSSALRCSIANQCITDASKTGITLGGRFDALPALQFQCLWMPKDASSKLWFPGSWTRSNKICLKEAFDIRFGGVLSTSMRKHVECCWDFSGGLVFYLLQAPLLNSPILMPKDAYSKLWFPGSWTRSNKICLKEAFDICFGEYEFGQWSLTPDALEYEFGQWSLTPDALEYEFGQWSLTPDALVPTVTLMPKDAYSKLWFPGSWTRSNKICLKEAFDICFGGVLSTSTSKHVGCCWDSGGLFLPSTSSITKFTYTAAFFTRLSPFPFSI
ncbi:hypothetical protein DKX38_002760 [Salix brachista]|uniref:Uncharacterized protein n=1 Tax=Salix brachista TaxID=2182728 RepID=A0A5N5NPJ3_9ROSI|nr:hypothetical protein DKX38_002760 [Salix brachista]